MLSHYSFDFLKGKKKEGSSYMLPVSRCVRGVYFSRTRVDAVAAHSPPTSISHAASAAASAFVGLLRRQNHLRRSSSTAESSATCAIPITRMINRLPRVYVLRAAGRSGLDGSMDPSAREHRRHGAQVARSVPASRSTHFVKTRACIWTGRNTNKR